MRSIFITGEDDREQFIDGVLGDFMHATRLEVDQEGSDDSWGDLGATMAQNQSQMQHEERVRKDREALDEVKEALWRFVRPPSHRDSRRFQSESELAVDSLNTAFPVVAYASLESTPMVASSAPSIPPPPTASIMSNGQSIPVASTSAWPDTPVASTSRLRPVPTSRDLGSRPAAQRNSALSRAIYSGIGFLARSVQREEERDPKWKGKGRAVD